MSGMTHLLRNFGDDISVRRARALRRMLILFTVFKISAFIVVGALAWLAVGQIAPGALDFGGLSLRSEVVGAAFNALFIVQMMDFSAGMGFGPLNWGQASRAFARTLTNIVATRDPRLAHELPILPASGAEANAGVEGARMIGPLSHPMRALGLPNAIYVIAALASVLPIGMSVLVTIISLYNPPSVERPFTLANALIWVSFPLCLLTVGVGGIIVALTTRHFARLERLPLMAQLDASGVTFTRAGDAGSTRRLAWGDARGLARLAYTDEMGWMHEVFALSGPQHDYLWESLFAGQSAPGSDEEASRVAAHQLTEEIARRTGLPLLDLTATMYAVMAATRATPYAMSGFFVRARKLAKRRGDTSLMHAIDQRQAQTGWLLGRFGGRAAGGVGKLSPQQQAETLRLAGDLLPYYPTPAQLAVIPGGWRFAGGYVISQFVFQILIVVLAVASVTAFNPL